MLCVHYATTCVGRKSNSMPMHLQMQKYVWKNIDYNGGYLGKGTR